MSFHLQRTIVTSRQKHYRPPHLLCGLRLKIDEITHQARSPLRTCLPIVIPCINPCVAAAEYRPSRAGRPLERHIPEIARYVELVPTMILHEQKIVQEPLENSLIRRRRALVVLRVERCPGVDEERGDGLVARKYG